METPEIAKLISPKHASWLAELRAEGILPPVPEPEPEQREAEHITTGGSIRVDQ